MSEMIERAAKAIYESRNGRGATPWSQRDNNHKQPYLEDARVTIKSMREATSDMLSAGAAARMSPVSTFLNAGSCWYAMIDEALK